MSTLRQPLGRPLVPPPVRQTSVGGRGVLTSAGAVLLVPAVVLLAACTPSGDPATVAHPTAVASSTWEPLDDGPGVDALVPPSSPTARLAVVSHGVTSGDDGQVHVEVLPEVVATGSDPVRIRYDDFWLVVPPEAAAAWSGLPDPAAWTTRAPDGAQVGMVPPNLPGATQRTGPTTPTRWSHPPVPQGSSSLDAPGPPGSLVFSVPRDDDGSPGVLGIALLGPERELIAYVAVDDWPDAVDPASF